jgi:hypothetical protein
MRRIRMIISAAVMLLALAPAGALAHHDRRHHRGRSHHARLERFGDVAGTAGFSDNAGKVQSFSKGVLTIMLGDGSTISGAVTNDTELECMAPERDRIVREDGGGDNGGSGDNQAQSSGDQGAGEDQGDAAGQNENPAEEQNADGTGERNENEAENSCSTANLTRGAVVHEAELRVSDAGNIWKRVELAS